MGRHVRFKIHYRRSDPAVWSAIVVIAVICSGYLLLRSPQPAASSPETPEVSTASMRCYYLSTTARNGATANIGCAYGYHMASFWEIVKPTNLKYNWSLGLTQSDSWYGPPTGVEGWVRTGGLTYASSTIPGQANCGSWNSTSGAHSGTTVSLPSDWTTGSDLHVWQASTAPCNALRYVWCIQNNFNASLALPLILK